MLGVYGLICLSSCSSGIYNSQGSSRNLVTLGDIYNNPATVRRVGLERISAQDAIDTYQRVYEETDDIAIKSEASIRMANLNLIATDDRILEQGILADKIEELSQENEKLLAFPENLDPVVEQEKNLRIQENAQAIELAKNKIIELDQTNLEFIDEAIVLYERILEENAESEDPISSKDNDKILYQLAAAYDSRAEQNKMISTLDRLVENHPESEYYIEVQFRRAESYFVIDDFLTASEAYQDVIQLEPEGRLAQHSLYKNGWSLYKLGEYQSAIDDFIDLRDNLTDTNSSDVNESVKSSNQELINDTDRVISLSFSYLESPKALFNYFKSIGGRPYELDIYRQLHISYEKQERYRDAAKTYDIFLDTYPTHKEAPLLQTEILQTYSDGGFPSLIVPGKIAYVKRFGIHSDYWKEYVDENAPQLNYSAEERLALVSEIKTHLSDISKYYHSRAQSGKNPADYQIASRWYQEYLDTFANKDGVDTAETLEIRKLLAESLYESGQEELAAGEFQLLAKSSGDNTQAGADASYFALLSYQRLLDKYKGDDEGRNLLVMEKINSSRYFIDNYQNDPRMPNALGNIVRDQLLVQDYEGAVKNSRILVNLDPPASEDLQRTAWVTIANAEFDAKDYANAEESYKRVLSFENFDNSQREKYTQQIAASIFKNAESIKENGDLNAAAEEFLRLGKAAPNSDIRPKAYFDAATSYIEAEEWQKSIDTLNQFENLFPNHELSETIPDKLAIAYKNTDQFDKAADQYIVLSSRYEQTDTELARQTLWEAALLKEEGENLKGAIDIYSNYSNTFKEPIEQSVEAQYRVYEYNKEQNNTSQTNLWRNKIIASYEQAGDQNTPRTIYLAAQMKFEKVEPDYTLYKSIKLTQPLKDSLDKKKAQMNITLSQYQDLSNLGAAEWTTAANHRIARVYQILANDLINSEQPKGLTEGQLEQYGYLIEDQAIPFEDKAIEIFAANSEMINNNIYDEWVKSSFSQLAKLIPGRYAKFEKRDNYVESIY